MSDLVTIKTFNNIDEAQRFQRKLKPVKIKARILRLGNPSANPPYEFVSLQVPENDVELALSIIEDEENSQSENSVFWEKVSILLSTTPVIQRFAPLYGFFILATVITSVIIVSAYFVFRTSTEEVLTSDIWCAKYVVHKKVLHTPHTVLKNPNFLLRMSDSCKETVLFNRNHSISLPGFETKNIEGNWHADGNYLILSNISELANIFEGKYLVTEIKDGLQLTSDSTVIVIQRSPKISYPWRQDFTKPPSRYGQPHL